MGPKMNAGQQRHVGALGSTLGETQVTSAHPLRHSTGERHRPMLTRQNRKGNVAPSSSKFCPPKKRQDQKGEKARVNPFKEGFKVCASRACDYFSNRKDGIPYEDARKLLDDFHPRLLKRIPPYC
jgi:hypothetical protein